MKNLLEALDTLYKSLTKLIESTEDETEEGEGDVSSFPPPAFRPMARVEDAPLSDIEAEAADYLARKYGISIDEIDEFFDSGEYVGADTLNYYRDAEEESETMDKAIHLAAKRLIQFLSDENSNFREFFAIY